VFAEKVLAAQASTTAAASKAAYEKTCTACEKTYFSENAFYNHVGSQKHRQQVARLHKLKAGGADDASSVVSSTLDSQITATETTADSESEEDSGEEDHVSAVTKNLQDVNMADGEQAAPGEKKKIEVPLKKCLFCNYESQTIDLNVHHMERIHNMFIPEKPYLVDLEGLLASLWEKINIFQECLGCGKFKPSVFGLQTHMRDKAHCKIPFHTEQEQLEIGEFYDFRSTYSDDEDYSDEETEDEETERKASGGVKLGARRPIKEEVEDEDEDMDGAGWETDSEDDDSSVDADDVSAAPMSNREHRYEKLSAHPHHSSRSDPRPHKSADGYHSHAHKQAHAAFYSDYELHLPSGRAVGHRSLAKYYRQNLHDHPSPAERQEQFMLEQARGSDEEVEVDARVARRDERERGRQLNTRANPNRGLVGVSEWKKREVAVAEKRAKAQEFRDRRKFEWGNNKKGNSQKHFRDPLLQ
jgi:pre-60S factor REI1